MECPLKGKIFLLRIGKVRDFKMRILVVSDTHGDYYSLKNAVQQQSKAEVILHLGDGEEELQSIRFRYSDRMVVGVRGNCDWGSGLPDTQDLVLAGKRIFMTHGHMYQVKMGYYTIDCAARERNADILLFGHTHVAMQEYADGLYSMNPGSLHAGGTYGIVDITDAGIVTNIVRLR